ncbi:MAG TPA: FtsX-like permease family protein [Phnomibacter sp.]|nr:FtsX-like permease family protein [Phnomibacter sp.]
MGLSVYSAQQRAKEISIRKVLGASLSGLVAYQSRELMIMAGIGLLIAIPVTWWVMQQWLAQFAYRTSLHWWLFGLAGSVVLFIAFITISIQAIRVALADPVKSLRSE